MIIFVQIQENPGNSETGGEFSEKLVAPGAPIDKQFVGGTRTMKGNVDMIPVGHGGARPWTRANGNWKGVYGEAGFFLRASLRAIVESQPRSPSSPRSTPI